MAVTVAASGPESATVVKTGAESLGKLEKFIAEQAEAYGFTRQNTQNLHAAIRQEQALSHLDEHSLKTVILNAFDHVQSKTSVGGATTLTRSKVVEISDVIEASQRVTRLQGRTKAERSEMLEMLKNRAAANEAEAVVTGIVPNKKWASGLTAEKVNGGIWLAGAALSLLGVYGAGKNAFTKDDNGKNQIQWSQAGVALLQACLAAGCAYMGVQSLRAAAR